MAKESFFDTAYTLKTSEETQKMYDRWAKVYDRNRYHTKISIY